MTELERAAREWAEARTATIANVTPTTFDRLARAEAALMAAVKALGPEA